MRVCTSCKKLLKADAMRCPDDGAASEVVDALPAGTKLGQYRIERMLGEGGMGFVYAAKHETLNRPTAVKMLRPEYASHSHIVTRFLNEAKAANLINHQNIVSIYDYGTADDGSVYFIMEYLEGEALDDLMHKRRPMPVPLLVHLFGQIAKALAAAHAKKIIHRDLKPANVFVVAKEENPYFVKLLDFGIAQLRVSSADKITLAGSVLGTPQYMSPEQVMGQNVDERSDVWAMGVMMYRAATGQAAFKGEEFAELAPKILAQVVQPPGEIMQLPVALSQLIMSCLERELERRCPSVTALIQGLEKVKQEIRFTDDELLEAIRADSIAHGHGMPTRVMPQSGVPKSEYPSIPRFIDRRSELLKEAGPAKPRRSPLRLILPAVAVAALGGAAFALTRTSPPAQGPQIATGSAGPGSGSAGPSQVVAPETILSLIEKGDVAGARAQAVDMLKQSITKGSLQDKGFAVDGLDIARVPRGAPLLYEALKQPPAVRVKAARALCELHLVDAAPKVRAALAEVSERMKNDLAGAMFCLGDKDSLAILKRALEEPTSKTSAALALADGGSALGRAVLEDRAHNDVGSEPWRKATAGLLKLGDPKAKQALIAERSQADSSRAVFAATVLATSGDADAKEQLARSAADPDFARRSEAALALARLGDKRALDWLPDGFRSSDPEEKQRAAAVFGMFAQDAKQHLLEIGKLATNDQDSRVRMTAAAALLGL